MNFDKIIMNPPYNGNLHLKILSESINNLTKDGECINLSPIRWLQDPLVRYKKNTDYIKFEESVSKYILSLDILSKKDCAELFGIALNADLGIYKIRWAGGYDYEKCRQYRGFSPDSFYEKIRKKTSKVLRSKMEKLSVMRTTNFCFIGLIGGISYRGIPCTHCMKPNYPYFINGLYDGKTPKQLKESNHLSVWGKIDEWPVIFFETGEEAKNFYFSNETAFFRFLCYAFTNNQDIPIKYLPWMGDCINPRTGLKGYLAEWTDEDFYKFFGITEDEQKLIENTMEKYK